MKLAVITSALLLGAAAGCTDRASAPSAAPIDSELPIEPAVDHQSAHDIPPATAPAAATAILRANGAVGFDGFSAAHWGADEQAVHEAWGAGLEAMPADMPESCRYLLPRARPSDGFGVGFMLEGERLVRVDVDRPEIEAPGGGRVGMTADRIVQLHGDDVEMQSHKYVDGGRYLRVPDPSGGQSVLVFETDAAGRVTAWRVGVPPQVDYVEGCS